MLAGALLDAEARMGELIKGIDKDKSYTGYQRRQSVLPEGITHKQSSAFQTLAENKDIIERVKADAEADDDLPTRTDVLERGKDNERKEGQTIPPYKIEVFEHSKIGKVQSK